MVITNTSTNQKFEVTSDSEGRFRASALPAGIYNLNASMSGFKSAEVDGVSVTGGMRANLTVNLEVGNISETVTVTASSSQSVGDLPTQDHRTIEFPVTERSEQWDTYQLSTFNRTQLEFFIAHRYIDEEMRAALQRIIDLRDKVAGADTRLAQINKEATEITQDQQRLRENVTALTSTSEARQLIARYVAKANEQETRMEQIEKDRRAIAAERSKLQADLEAAMRAFSLDRKL